jgi:hypothetical protein
MSTKEELIALLRLCNAPPAAIDVAEAAYELGYKTGMAKASLDNMDFKLREEYAAGFDSAPE